MTLTETTAIRGSTLGSKVFDVKFGLCASFSECAAGRPAQTAGPTSGKHYEASRRRL
jgi:hypothetical protein